MNTCIRAVIILFIAFKLLPLNVRGQNHVPNHSFEQYSGCPTGMNQFGLCLFWQGKFSPDYFNICGTAGGGIPNNGVGNEMPASGNGYAGLLTYFLHSVASNYREIMTTAITPLQIGNTYEVSMSVSLADASGYGSDNLGVYFYDNGPVTTPLGQVLPVVPQISYSSYGPITSKTGWVRLTATMYADSAYDNIIIGGFGLDSAMNRVATPPGTYGYYYIDSVVVKLATGIGMTFTDTGLCAGAAINVSYNVQNITVTPGNTFTLQLSDATGSFASPVNIGSVISTLSGVISGIIPSSTIPGAGYRLRVVSANPVYISNVSNPIIIGTTPANITVGNNSPVCEGSTINLNSSSTTPSVTYNWAGPAGFNSSIQNPARHAVLQSMSGYYVVAVTNNGCTVKDSTLITVNATPNLNASSNAPICTGGTLMLQVTSSNPGTTYNWYGPNGFMSGVQNPTIPNITTVANGVYTVVGTIPSSPCIDSAFVNITVGAIPAAPIAGNSTPICSGNTIVLNAQSTTQGVTYQWTGPGGYNSSLQNPFRINATTLMSGTYSVVALLAGCASASTNTNVIVDPSPANVTVSNNTPICTGDSIQLNANSSTPGVTFNWTGPGGYISNLQNPVRVNATPAMNGIYIVTVQLGNCNVSASTIVNIGQVPTIPTLASNSPVCAGQSINLTAHSLTPGVTYTWTGPISYTSNVQNPTRTNAATNMSGTYSVAASLAGCTSPSATTNVIVNPAPTNLAAGSNSPVCAGSTINLTSTGSGTGIIYTWVGPNGFTSNLQNPSMANATVNMSGSYTITAQIGSCSNSASTAVAISSLPATPSVGSNSPVCSGNSINLTAASSTPGVTYSWTGPGGYNSNQQNPVRNNATVAMSGTYTVTAAIGACPAAPVSTQVTVNQTPTAPTATNNGPLCAGAALDLFATGLTGATYQWNGPAGYNSNAQNPTILNSTTSNAGSYTVTRTVNGCTSAPGTTNVVINNSVNPAIAVFPSPNDTICPGQAVVFVASPNNGGTAPQYQWKKNGNNITGATAANYNTTAISSGDFFSCEMISSAACAFPQTVQSNNVLMTVEPPQPCAASITANPGLVLSPWELVTFTATPVRGGVLPSYQWLRNGKPVIGAVSATWGANNLSSNDTISVVLFSTDPCAVPNTDTSNYLVVNIKTGINSINGVEGLTLYPNPNNGSFIIRGKINTKEADIEIVNALGQQVYTEKLVQTSGWLDHKIHLNAASGVYLLKARTNEGTQTIRFQLNN